MKRWLSPTLRLAITLALLAALAWQLDSGRIVQQLASLQPGWAVIGVALGVPQVVISAWRWRLTAGEMGIPLGWARAIREYYLASFLNQVLPGGVMGDAARAWRHGGQPEQRVPRGAAFRAVVIERASGQLALALIALAAIVASPALHAAIASQLRAWEVTMPLLLGLALAAVLVASGVTLILRSALGHRLKPFAEDLQRSLFAARVWPRQLVGSLLVVATYVGVFLCAAQALGLERASLALLPLIPPLLMVMAIPLSVAGWGLREGAAALIWPLVGWPSAEGVALSVTYGLLVLIASLPGLVVLLLDHRRRRGPMATPATLGEAP